MELLGWKETPYHLAHARYDGRLRFHLFHQKVEGGSWKLRLVSLVRHGPILWDTPRATRKVRVRIKGPTIPLQQ